MASFKICWRFLTTADSLLKKITCFWEIMWIEANSQSKPSCFYWRTRSSTLKISSFWGATTNLPKSISSMASMTNVSNFKLRQKKVFPQNMEIFHRLLQRHAYRCNYRIENTLHAWRNQSLAAKDQEASHSQQTNWYTKSRDVMRSALGWPSIRTKRVALKQRKRYQLSFWCGCA